MRAVIAGLLIALLPVVGNAFNIRSGEHDGFSRLVVRFDQRPNWELAPSDKGYILKSEGIPIGRDFSQVFQLIPRTRLADIRQEEETGHLFFDLACDCHAETFELANNRLVIDFKPGPDPKPDQSKKENPQDAVLVAEPDEDPKPEVAALPETDEPELPVSAVPSLAAHGIMDLPTPNADLQTESPEKMVPAIAAAEIEPEANSIPSESREAATATDEFPIQAPEKKHVEQTTDHLEDTDPKRSEDIAGFERELASTLAKAMTDGLIDTPTLPKLDEALGEVDQGNGGSSLHSLSEIPKPGPDSPPRNHRSSTQVEIDQIIDGPRSQGTSRSQCEGAALPAFLMVEGETYSDLSDYRAGIIDAGGRVLPDGLEELMRFYLRHGFGIEARQIVTLPEFEAEHASIYLAISYLVEGERPPAPNELEDQLRCGGNGAIWGFLTSDRIPSLTKDMRNSIAKSFLLLPSGMKQAIGPELAERLIEIRETRMAKTMLAQLERSARTGTVAGIARAELAMIDEDYTKARSILNEEIATNSVSAPDALLLLLGKLDEFALDETELQHMLVLADAYAFEHRGTPLETRLKRVTLHRKAQAGDLRSALNSLTTLDLTGDGERQALLADLLRTGLPQLDDFGLAVFLSTEMGMLNFLGPGDPVLSETLLRASNIGLPGLTARLLRQFPDTDQDLRAELRASVALDRRDVTRMAEVIDKVSPASRDVLENRLEIRRRLPVRASVAPAARPSNAPVPETGSNNPNPTSSNETTTGSNEDADPEPETAFESSDNALRGADDVLERLKRELEKTSDAPSS
jgi:hypothetical protein